MTTEHDDTEVTKRLDGLTFTACATLAAAEQLAAIAAQVAGGLNGLRDDLRGQAPLLTDGNREPGFFRVAIGTGAVIDASERGEQHVRMATAAAGLGEPAADELPAVSAEQIPRIMADLWALAARHDLDLGAIFQAAMKTSRDRAGSS
jgi:hypothetical protein